MKEKESLAIALEIFRLIKQFPLPRPKLKKNSIDGLTRSEYELLVMLVISLGDDKQAFTVTEISNLLQITPAGVTHLINPLEEVGYIERLQAPKDRRVVLIGLTEKGNQVADALILEIQEQLIGLVNHLGEKDSETLFRLLSKSINFFNERFEINKVTKL
jgi:DNA-binding MarR family transcriptional regulator